MAGSSSEDPGGLSSRYVFPQLTIGIKLTFLQVANFLNKMAREIDTNIPGVVEHPERLPGNIASHSGANKEPDLAPKPEFDSMRRKLALPLGL